MDMTNEIMFYGGMILVGISVMGILVYWLIARLKKIRLDIQLDQEYGKNGEE